jgi:5,10-methylenetetrahydromethanopterin reductase
VANQSDDSARQGLAPLVEDMSIYVLSGRVSTREAPGVTPAHRGVGDAVEAERLGFRRVFLSERFDLKDAGVQLSAMAGRTTRLEVGTGCMTPASRHPIVGAAFGATMHAVHGPRFVLGIGRGMDFWGMPELKMRQVTEYVTMLKRLWAGEQFVYQAPGGAPADIKLLDGLGDIPAPKVWLFTFGGPVAAQAVANPVYDGVMFYPFMTVEAVANAVNRIHAACERVGRDPKTLRICHPIVTAPELDDFSTRAYAHARCVTYLDYPRHGENMARANGWDEKVIERLRNHELLGGERADAKFHRAQLVELSHVIPDEWIEATAALGSIEHCVSVLRKYRAVGVDEIAVYGSTPQENAGLIAAWRENADQGLVLA